MKNSKTLFQDFVKGVTIKETQEEIKSMAYLVFESVYGWSKADVLAEKTIPDGANDDKLESIIQRLNECEPVQYILGQAAFFGRMFTVNHHVLIPRPETEELTRLVIDFVRQRGMPNAHIIDLGTGSGCIAVTLALELPSCEVFATDMSNNALQVASHNALSMGAHVKFIEHDILTSELPCTADIVVSNPPYITRSERVQMQRNVVDYEPEKALFVDSEDPLLFYKAIVDRAKKSLAPGGLLAVEINERYGDEVRELFKTNSYKDVLLVRDLFGKDRFVKGILSS